MNLLPFEKLPPEFQNDKVKPYYDILDKKRRSLFLKRLTDILLSVIMIVFLFIPMLIIAVMIKCTSKGPVFYKQERVTQYGKNFKILKFRSMQVGADQCGELLTCKNDTRITNIGKILRKYRLDELPQIFHVFTGKMSLVGTRPEVTKYVMRYTPEMMATLLMPAGITSFASIKFKDENEMLDGAVNVDDFYVEKILPLKMRYNLKYISRFGFRKDLHLLYRTAKDIFLKR